MNTAAHETHVQHPGGPGGHAPTTFEKEPSTPPGVGTDGKAAKKVREAVNVAMNDGRTVEFVGKQLMLKEALVHGQKEDGTEIWIPIDEVSLEDLSKVHIKDVAIRLDFRNGATRTYPLNPHLGLRYAGHGGLQKYGDQLAGGVKNEDGTVSTDLDDWAYATDELHEQLMKGEWSKTRVGGGGGISILIQALMRFTQRTLEEVKEHIKDWTPAQKQQLAVDPEIKPIIDAIQLEKAAKASHVDVSALKSGLRGLVKADAETEA
jgi:hypothetical protein